MAGMAGRILYFIIFTINGLQTFIYKAYQACILFMRHKNEKKESESKPGDIDSPEKELSKIKLQAEVKKIHLEIANLQRWPHWQLLATLVVTLSAPALALFLSYRLIGEKYFDVSEKIVKLENMELKYQKDSLQNQKIILEKEVHLIQVHKDMMSGIVDSLRKVTDSFHFKAIEITSQLERTKSEAKMALETEMAKSENEKELIPIRAIVYSIAGLHPDIDVPIDDGTFRSLMNKLNRGYYNPIVSSFINDFVNNDTIKPVAKTDVLIAAYLATKDENIKVRLKKLLSQNIGAYYSTKLHWVGWNKSDIHNNIKFVIRLINTDQIVNIKNAESLNEILKDIIGRFNYVGFFSHPTIIDSMLNPEFDYLSFIDLLKAYRHVNIEWPVNNIKRDHLISGAFDRWHNPAIAFFYISVKQEIAKSNGESYIKNFPNFNWGGSGDLSFLVQNIPNPSKDISGWNTWGDKNLALINRLKEPDFETYRKNPEQLKEDFK